MLDTFEIIAIRQTDEIERWYKARYRTAMLYARADVGNEAFYLLVGCIRDRCWSNDTVSQAARRTDRC